MGTRVTCWSDSQPDFDLWLTDSQLDSHLNDLRIDLQFGSRTRRSSSNYCNAALLVAHNSIRFDTTSNKEPFITEKPAPWSKCRIQGKGSLFKAVLNLRCTWNCKFCTKDLRLDSDLQPHLRTFMHGNAYGQAQVITVHQSSIIYILKQCRKNKVKNKTSGQQYISKTSWKIMYCLFL